MVNAQPIYSTLIRVTELATLTASGPTPPVIIDCRFELSDVEAGEAAYRAGHIPGALYAHLDRDLSGPKAADGRGGRHPLPSPAALTQIFSRWGIGPATQVVVYDDHGGHYAARLWWMLRYMGHEAVAVLDGGWREWAAAGLPTATGETPLPAPRLFTGAPHTERLVLIDEVESLPLLIDSRQPERYRGDVEPIDPVAGHIPGAINRPFSQNWTADGVWRPPQDLLADFIDLLGDTPPEAATFYCGSGVSACVNLLAMVRAGLPEGRLYLGSWSEWSRSSDRPRARG